MECQYCNKIFSVKSSLLHHQKTAKFCIKKRGIVDNEIYKCDHCNSIFKYSFNINQKINEHKIKTK